MTVPGRDITKSLDDRQIRTFRQYNGDIFLKYEDDDNSQDSAHVAIREKRIGMHVKQGKVGININDSGKILIQGNPVIKASGKNIIKGDYTENPDSVKPFTYTETIDIEATAKEEIYDALGEAGVDVSDLINTGMGQLMTNVSGYPPHVHTMMFKHVHAVEPAYLFRMPLVSMLDNVVDKLQEFLNL